MPSPFTLPSLYKILRRSRWSASDASVVLDALVASGCSVATFARTHRIDARRIYPWQRRLRPATDAKSEMDCLRFVELALLYGACLLLGRLAESRLHGAPYPQSWEFYVIGVCLFLVAAFPGFIYRYMWGKDH